MTETRAGFTGRHMALVMAAGFGTVIAVNVTMAALASSTFTGIVAKNGYVASIDYAQNARNRNAAKALGWSIAVTGEAGGIAVTVRDPAGAPVGAAVAGTAEHTEGGERLPLQFAPDAATATAALEPGGWIVRLHLTRGGDALDWRAPVWVQ